MKKYILTITFTIVQMSVLGQTINIHFKNGQTIEYPSNNVDYVDFSAKVSDPTVTAGDAIDLGLSVYWSSCNLGASKIEDYGSFYSWGETASKSTFSRDNYAFFNFDTYEYINIGDNIAGTEYDAATVNLGSDWRLPTKAEMEELLTQCTFEFTKINGNNGFKVTGPNGNSIFLPATGYIPLGILIFRNEGFCYWTSEIDLYYNNKQCASTLLKQEGAPSLSPCNRYIGCAIRPVTNNPNANK